MTSSQRRRVRAQVVRIVDHRDAITVIGRGGDAFRFDGDSAALVRAVVAAHAAPLSRAELIAHLAELSGAAVPEQPVDELMALLVREGVLVDAAAGVATAPAPLSGRRVLLGVSGAVAAVDAPALVRMLQADGCEVCVAMTRAARRFASRRALQALTHREVFSDLWHGDPRHPAPHIDLAEWAELVVVCPATATTLARLAAGDASDVVSAAVCATRAPVVVVPSMNDAMYASPAVERALAQLSDDGRYLVHPARGVEVAHPPAARRPLLGPAPPAAAVVAIVRHLFAHTSLAPFVPAGADDWERLWARTPAERLPWHQQEVDAALAAELDALAPAAGKRFLDLGTGAGTVAIAAARRGFAVTATDVAPSALAEARRRADDLPILFALDDATRTGLRGRFDVVHDRGLLHCLPRAAHPGYAAALARLVAPGGTLLVAAHAGPGAGTTPLAEAEARQLLGQFTLSRSVETALAGRPAHLFVFARGRDGEAA